MASLVAQTRWQAVADAASAAAAAAAAVPHAGKVAVLWSKRNGQGRRREGGRRRSREGRKLAVSASEASFRRRGSCGRGHLR